ncbi:class I SAM-dependent methyltransferase [Enterococcus sp. BWB1-3]|uniref:class I SAM-dependent methyltransferase n=1 Tax=unclassified Enterococcus TaxID=2608891 RepID=UPI0019227FA0|nr:MULTISPECIES: class I SAM-dependent methyltransferase [unclassified Enterococcus]MBL1229960.1 class I SAM-dependent methyltransferase [Enterococcus sp. BWB1-3]MCB5952958.1 class I SAM-dependent methyltransferase [Enterococcus sp. BWT-B8]MCB5953535.1 class I SAM-dependent methyltransferase [Enterococcus sp. CWB-B31]
MNHSHHPTNPDFFQKKVANLEQHRIETITFEEIAALLAIQSTDKIADLGAGTGYFTFPLAEIAETVIAVDLDMQMLAYIKEKMENQQMSNIKPVHSALTNLPLENHSVDKALASIALHEIPELSQALDEIKRILKSGGYFLCVEIERDVTGTHNHPRITQEEMRKYLLEAGFTIIDERIPTKGIYAITAQI